MSSEEKSPKKHLSAKQAPGVHVTEPPSREQYLTLVLIPFLHSDLLPIVLAYAASNFLYDGIFTSVEEVKAALTPPSSLLQRAKHTLQGKQHSEHFMRLLGRYQPPSLLDDSPSNFEMDTYPPNLISHRSNLKNYFEKAYQFAVLYIELTLVVDNISLEGLRLNPTTKDRAKAQSLRSELEQELDTLKLQTPPKDIYEAIMQCTSQLVQQHRQLASTLSAQICQDYTACIHSTITTLSGSLTLIKIAQEGRLDNIAVPARDHLTPAADRYFLPAYKKTLISQRLAGATLHLKGKEKFSQNYINYREYSFQLSELAKWLEDPVIPFFNRLEPEAYGKAIGNIIQQLLTAIKKEQTQSFKLLQESKQLPIAPQYGSLHHHQPSAPTLPTEEHPFVEPPQNKELATGGAS